MGKPPKRLPRAAASPEILPPTFKATTFTMVDYSKWDNIELSDDSDAAKHPIHSKSALKHTKQKRAHNLRRERKSQIEALEYEETVNNEIVRRLQTLARILKDTPPNAQTSQEILSLALAQTVPASCEEDTPPQPNPAVSSAPTYSEMMKVIATSMEQALDTTNVDKADCTSDILEAVESQAQSIKLRQDAIAKQLKRYETRKITSESYRVTCDSSNINKSMPGSMTPTGSVGIEEEPPDHESRDPHQISELTLQFAKTDPANYRASEMFITSHREILQDQAIQDILNLAQRFTEVGHDMLAYRHVHQALVLQWCRSLGEDGVAIFFRRVTTRQQARDSFLKEVANRFHQMREAAVRR